MTGPIARLGVALLVGAGVLGGAALTGVLPRGGPRVPPPATGQPRPLVTTTPLGTAAAAPTQEPLPTATPDNRPTPTPEGPNFIVLRARDVAPDAHLNVVGQGFRPLEQIAVAFEDLRGAQEAEGEPIAADAEGRLNDTGIALATGLAPGEHRLRLEGQTSHRVARATFRLYRVPPRVELQEYSIKADSNVSFSGSGFAAGEEVEVRLGGLGGDPLARVRADERGDVVKGVARVPLIKPGDYPLYFVGRTSQTPASVGLNVRGFTPWVLLDNYSPPPYYSMGFSGEDFAPGEEVLVYLNEARGEPAARVVADPQGHFEVKDALPLPELLGDTTLVFVGRVTGKELRATFNALPFMPSLELTVYAGRPGLPVGFIGSLWARGETLRAYIGDAKGGLKRVQVATFEADQGGTFRGAGVFRLPPSVEAGGLPLTVVGDVSHAEVTLWFEVLKLKPSAELTAYRGLSGTTVEFSGNGFAGGETVTVHLREKNGPVLAQSQASDLGSFGRVGSFTVEGDPDAEAVPFVFVGEESHAEAMTHFKVTGPVAP